VRGGKKEVGEEPNCTPARKSSINHSKLYSVGSITQRIVLGMLGAVVHQVRQTSTNPKISQIKRSASPLIRQSASSQIFRSAISYSSFFTNLLTTTIMTNYYNTLHDNHFVNRIFFDMETMTLRRLRSPGISKLR
jgi:hypothetical protein